uniref:ZIP family metal transporter n=1 Tax=Ignisphaera aggregans TaxID=334771 RepID=A0A7C4BC46_9CREN
MELSVFQASLAYGFFIAGATSLGSVASLALRRASFKWLDFGLGFAAGIMIVTSFLSLIVPTISEGLYVDMGIGIGLGMAVIVLLDALLPHEHTVLGYEGPAALRARVRKSWLVALAIVIHNFPEGLAVGVATAFSPATGLSTALAIGVQDAPEGFAVSMPLVLAERKRLKALLVGVLSGLTETVMCVAGALLFSIARALLGIGMGFAAGAMIYVAVEEILPEVLHEKAGNRKLATLGFILGLYTMLYLETLVS